MLYTYLANINYGELNFPSLEYSDVSYPFFFISQFSGAYFIFLSFFFFRSPFCFSLFILWLSFYRGKQVSLAQNMDLMMIYQLLFFERSISEEEKMHLPSCIPFNAFRSVHLESNSILSRISGFLHLRFILHSFCGFTFVFSKKMAKPNIFLLELSNVVFDLIFSPFYVNIWKISKPNLFIFL